MTTSGKRESHIPQAEVTVVSTLCVPPQRLLEQLKAETGEDPNVVEGDREAVAYAVRVAGR